MKKTSSLAATLQALLQPGKGILAADESFSTIEKRFKSLGIPSTEENRRAYRELLFTAPGVEKFISGAILFDETLRQKSLSGTPLGEVLRQRGIVPGIKVDKGTVALPGFPGELITQGLDGLRERLAEYHALGARFTKWRAVIKIGKGQPTAAAVEANAHALALFAALSQEADLVPIVEPEVLIDGNHTLEKCEEILQTTLETVFAELVKHRVSLEHMILKSSMVLSGEDCPKQASDAEVAAATVRVFRRTVPAAVPGIVFLSGGQSPKEATSRLAAINKLPGSPWTLTFSYGRALQDDAMKTWSGSPVKIKAAQKALFNVAKRNGTALQR